MCESLEELKCLLDKVSKVEDEDISNDAIFLSKEDLEIFISFLHKFSPRQCNCCIRDYKQFEKLNLITQQLILMCVKQIKCLRTKFHHPNCATETYVKDEEKKSDDSQNIECEMPLKTGRRLGNLSEINKHEAHDDIWSLEDIDKLLGVCSKVFLLNFPLYVAYKHTVQSKLEELSQSEATILSIFCDIHDPEIPIFLLKNVCFFCRLGGIQVMSSCFDDQSPSVLPLSLAHTMISVIANLKLWLNFRSVVQFLVPLRTVVLRYMCKLTEKDFRNAGIRNMADFMWNAIKDPLEAPLTFDKEGLDLAFKYFTSTTLTMRLAGIAQINSHINMFNELCNSESIIEAENVGINLANWLLSNQIVEHIFGPNLHVEIIKQSHVVLNFLAMEGKLKCEHIDVIWASAQLKHCSRQVFDILATLIKNLEAGPVMHLYNLLSKLEVREHSEQSLLLASSLIKFIWSSGRNYSHILTTGHNPYSLLLKDSISNVDPPSRHDLSSSENSVSVDASESGDERLRCCLTNNHKIIHGMREGTSSGQKHFNHNAQYFHGSQSEEDSSEDEEGCSLGIHEEPVEDGNSIPDSEDGATNTRGSSHSDSDADEEQSNEELNSELMLSRKKMFRKKRLEVVKLVGKYSNPKKSVDSEENDDKCDLSDIKSNKISEHNGINEKVSESPYFEVCDQKLVTAGDSTDSFVVKVAETSVMKANGLFVGKLNESNLIADDVMSEEGSCSSRLSNKSVKNMADFEGEDSEEELVQLAAQAQYSSTPMQRQLEKMASMYHSHFLPTDSVNKSENDQSKIFPRFNIDSVCLPGNTLLWDLLSDDNIIHLADGLSFEAEKALCNLLCFNSDRIIRKKFIEGCLTNLSSNRTVIVSLRLLPKLFASFQQFRGSDIHLTTIWAEKEHHMMNKFFDNLKAYKTNKYESLSLYSHQAEIQVRLGFLTSIFSSVGSPDSFHLNVEQVDILWTCLSDDPECSDELFNWFLSQAKTKGYHALNIEAFKYIFLEKLPLLKPQTISMTALGLFQHLCNLAHLSKSLPKGVSSQTELICMDQLWSIALKANSSEVSMAAINYLNNYYIAGHPNLEAEPEFVSNCMSSLKYAQDHVEEDEETSLFIIQRALVLLKTHLQVFKRKYAFHLRKWALDGYGVCSHQKIFERDRGQVIRIICQPASLSDKFTLEMFTHDYVGDLRAEITKLWENYQKSRNEGEKNSAPIPAILSDGTVRLITQGQELVPDFDEKMLHEIGMKDLQMVFVSIGSSRVQHRKDLNEPTSLLPPPPRELLPMILLLKSEYFEQLFSLMQQLSNLKSTDKLGNVIPHTKAQILSRRVWDLLMLLPTSPNLFNIFVKLEGCSKKLQELLDPTMPQKLMYSLYIVETLGEPSYKRKSKLDKISNLKLSTENEIWKSETKQNDEISFSSKYVCDWTEQFLEHGGLQHLFDIFMSGVLQPHENRDWSEWQQDCLASLLKLLCQFGIITNDLNCDKNYLNDNEFPKKRCNKILRSDKLIVPRLNSSMLKLMNNKKVLERLTSILKGASLPRDPNYYKTGFWGRSQVVHYALSLLVYWVHSDEEVRTSLFSSDLTSWLQALILDDPEPSVRRETATGLYKMCLGVTVDGKTGLNCCVPLLSSLLQFLPIACNMKPSRLEHEDDNSKEPYGPACRDYFWLICRLVDSVENLSCKDSAEDLATSYIDINDLSQKIANSILERDFLEVRHSNIEDDGLIGLLNLETMLMKQEPSFKTSKEGQEFIITVFTYLFALPSPKHRYLPKCKSQASRSAAYDLLVELVKASHNNYKILISKLMEQQEPSSHQVYPWDYWPHEDGRSDCGYVGLTNLGATCYMASCMQHLYMMPQARSSILRANPTDEGRHDAVLRELQRMFAYLLESERKAYNPRSFCKVYTMDHQPLNTGEQKDMAEFFIDLVSKLEDMTPELKILVKNLFCGQLTNNVISLDCPHVSRTLEEFYTVRCQVADMRNLYESLDEVTVKDTLEGDNMYTCSHCGKKVRAEKRACFKQLPKILCFNTMRYTFNMVTMMKEKVNTHFSFPLRLDMGGYIEKNLMPHAGDEGTSTSKKDIVHDEIYEYDLIGVTVHTGTADGGHYYSFIRDRTASNKDRWFLFNDAEVKLFDPNQIAAECFGGEMTSKTYDSVTDKFMDFSFEKTNSAYMLFYEKCSQDIVEQSCSKNGFELDNQLLKEGASLNSTQPSGIELSKELEDWIWQDNMHFLRDKSIFEHTYFNFMWQICGYIPQTLGGGNDVIFIAAQLSTSFFLETFIHAKEKPTMVQWVELLTKQLNASQSACEWLLDHMAISDWWPVQILIKCPNQMVRQMFQRLCIHIIQRLRPSHAHLYLQSLSHSNDNLDTIGMMSCVTRFANKLLNLLEHNATKSYLKNLTEYYSFLLEFARMGDEECQFLLSCHSISRMIHFYLGNKSETSETPNSEEEEEDEYEFLPMPAVQYSKPQSLEKMITLIALLVEKSRRDDHSLHLSDKDLQSIAGGKGFPFLYQQIKDGINLKQTCNIIFSISRWNDTLADSVIEMIFQVIARHQILSQPFFKLLSMLVEFVGGPPGLPCFTQLILQRIWEPEVIECCSQHILDWLAIQVPKNKVANAWVIQNLDSLLEPFLIGDQDQRVRNAAAYLLVQLVPCPQFRKGFRARNIINQHGDMELTMNTDSQIILHQLYEALLRFLKRAKMYADIRAHGPAQLTTYFALLGYCVVSKAEKIMFSPYFNDLWQLFHPKLSEPSISIHHNKQALLVFWYTVLLDCPENIHLILQNSTVTKNIAFNYILADHEDQEVVLFNRCMLPVYYGILRLCCQQSSSFTRQLAIHQNIQWAFRNITPYTTQYSAAIEELFKLMKLFVTKPPDASDQDIAEINQFRHNTLQLYLQILDARSSWSTLIMAFNILLDSNEDRLFAVYNGGLSMLFEAFHSLHVMYHEATACHVLGDLVDLLTLTLELLHFVRVMQENKDVRTALSSCKNRPDTIRKLTTLLNSYNPPELRQVCIDILREFLVLFPVELIQNLVPLLSHCHLSYRENPTPIQMGPYFPKRGQKIGVGFKANIRPQKPMVHMILPHSAVECSKDVDEHYSNALKEFYLPYHQLVDIMCRVAMNRGLMSEALINLSAMLGYEGVPLRLALFPKLWTDVHNTTSIDRQYFNLLIKSSYLTDYIEAVFLDERASLNNSVIFTFLQIIFPLVNFNMTDAMKTLMGNLINSVCNAADTADIVSAANRLSGDLRALLLMYSCEEGHVPKTLLIQALNKMMGKIQSSKIDNTYSEEIPNKKRKTVMENGSPSSININESNENEADTVSQKNILPLKIPSIENLVKAVMSLKHELEKVPTSKS